MLAGWQIIAVKGVKFNTFAFLISILSSFISLSRCRRRIEWVVNGKFANTLTQRLWTRNWPLGMFFLSFYCFFFHIKFIFLVLCRRHSSGVVCYSGMSLNGPAREKNASGRWIVQALIFYATLFMFNVIISWN